jgi:hypothetical protein
MRDGLARRGVDVSAAVAGDLVLRHATATAAPPHLAAAASAGANTSSLATSSGAAIARNASRMMLVSKLKAAAVVVLVSSLALAAAGGSVAHFARAGSTGGAGGRGAGDAMELQDVVFEPVGQGKSIAHVKLKTPAGATTRMSTLIILQARSSDGRGQWKGYAAFGGALPGGVADVRVPFQIPEPFGPRAGVTVNIYRDDQPTADIWKTGRTPPTLYTRQFTVAKLPQRTIDWANLPAANDAQAAEARALLASVQQLLHLGLYSHAQELFSTDWTVAENAPIRDWFRKRVFPAPADASQFTWDGPRLQKFEPRDARMNGDAIVLLVAYKSETRAVEMVREKGKLKIDWIYPAIPGMRASTTTAAAAATTTQPRGGT